MYVSLLLLLFLCLRSGCHKRELEKLLLHCVCSCASSSLIRLFSDLNGDFREPYKSLLFAWFVIYPLIFFIFLVFGFNFLLLYYFYFYLSSIKKVVWSEREWRKLHVLYTYTFRLNISHLTSRCPTVVERNIEFKYKSPFSS